MPLLGANSLWFVFQYSNYGLGQNTVSLNNLNEMKFGLFMAVPFQKFLGKFPKIPGDQDSYFVQTHSFAVHLVFNMRVIILCVHVVDKVVSVNRNVWCVNRPTHKFCTCTYKCVTAVCKGECEPLHVKQ